MNYSELLKESNAIQKELVEIRRELHSNPEVGIDVPWTKNFIKNKLIQYGYDVKELKSGLLTSISNSVGKCILLRSDIDGLKIEEKTDLKFKSSNGCMHACGHDMHATMLLGACKLLQLHKSEIKGTIKIVFQADEEGFTGAKKMISENVLENPHVDCAFALHVHSGTLSNMVLYSTKYMMASCMLFRIKIKGKGCHGAMPETGIDPINIASHIVTSLQEINAREISATNSAVLTIGKIYGGSAPNIIPEEVVIEGTIRAFTIELTNQIFKRINEISSSISNAFRGSCEVTEIASAPPLFNDVCLTEKFTSYLKDVFDPKMIYDMKSGGMGSEDFASFTYKVPCTYLLLGAGSKDENDLFGRPMHNEKVVFNEDILHVGSFIHSYLALRYLSEN